jgi:hypothetical protein
MIYCCRDVEIQSSNDASLILTNVQLQMAVEFKAKGPKSKKFASIGVKI